MGIETKFSISHIKRLPYADFIPCSDVQRLHEHLNARLEPLLKERQLIRYHDLREAWQSYDGRQAPPGPRLPRALEEHDYLLGDGYRASLIDEPDRDYRCNGRQGAFLVLAQKEGCSERDCALPVLRLDYHGHDSTRKTI